jgi:hypothetical protein
MIRFLIVPGLEVTFPRVRCFLQLLKGLRLHTVHSRAHSSPALSAITLAVGKDLQTPSNDWYQQIDPEG